MKITKYSYNVRKEATHKVKQKVAHRWSVSEILHIKSQVNGVYMIQKKRKKNETCVELGQNMLPSRYHTPTVNISDFHDNILKFRY